jgi:hypothetical protein
MSLGVAITRRPLGRALDLNRRACQTLDARFAQTLLNRVNMSLDPSALFQRDLDLVQSRRRTGLHDLSEHCAVLVGKLGRASPLGHRSASCTVINAPNDTLFL